MEPPPPKRLRRIPCYCPACRGCERDMCTVCHQESYSLPVPDTADSGGSHQPINTIHTEDEDEISINVTAITTVSNSSVEEHSVWILY